MMVGDGLGGGDTIPYLSGNLPLSCRIYTLELAVSRIWNNWTCVSEKNYGSEKNLLMRKILGLKNFVSEKI